MGVPILCLSSHVSEFMNCVPHFFSPPLLSSFLPSLTPTINTVMNIKLHCNHGADMMQYKEALENDTEYEHVESEPKAGETQKMTNSFIEEMTAKLRELSRRLWRRQRHPTPVLLPGKSYGRRSLVGCSPSGREESGMTERLHFHFSLSCVGEGNGNPPQCSCLENPRDGGAWWAAQSRSASGVAQSQTQLSNLAAAAARCVGLQRPVSRMSTWNWSDCT